MSTEISAAQNIRFSDIASRQGVRWTVRRFIREWPLVPLALLSVIMVFAVFASVISGYDPTFGELTDRLIPPAWYEEGSTAHLLGTDPLGRDVMTRIMHGARISLMVAGIVLLRRGHLRDSAGHDLGLVRGCHRRDYPAFRRIYNRVAVHPGGPGSSNCPWREAGGDHHPPGDIQLGRFYAPGARRDIATQEHGLHSARQDRRSVDHSHSSRATSCPAS